MEAINLSMPGLAVTLISVTVVQNGVILDFILKLGLIRFAVGLDMLQEKLSALI